MLAWFRICSYIGETWRFLGRNNYQDLALHICMIFVKGLYESVTSFSRFTWAGSRFQQYPVWNNYVEKQNIPTYVLSPRSHTSKPFVWSGPKWISSKNVWTILLFFRFLQISTDVAPVSEKISFDKTLKYFTYNWSCNRPCMDDYDKSIPVLLGWIHKFG